MALTSDEQGYAAPLAMTTSGILGVRRAERLRGELSAPGEDRRAGG